MHPLEQHKTKFGKNIISRYFQQMIDVRFLYKLLLSVVKMWRRANNAQRSFNIYIVSRNL